MSYEESEVLALRAEIADLRAEIAELKRKLGIEPKYVLCKEPGCGWRMYPGQGEGNAEPRLVAEHLKHYRRFHGRISVPPSPWPD